MKTRFEIDADIRRARTLPAWCYRDAEFFATCREQVFARSWQIVSAEAPQGSGAVPFTFLEPLVDEPLLLTRDEAGTVRCLSNVCTHRGSLLATCPTDTLRCSYHGRRFALDGSFVSMPGFEEARDFPSKTDDLPALPLHRLGPFWMTALDPAWTFGDVFGPIQTMFERELQLDATRTRTYHVRANWMLYLENFLEGFHIPFVHPDLHAVLGNAPYEIELFRAANVQIAYDRDTPTSVAARYAFAFPNLMFNFYPWGLSLNVAIPIGVAETLVHFQSWVADPTKLDVGVSADLDLVQREDEEAVESVQRGIRSRLYERGRYSPRHERAVHHFHRLLVDALGSA